MPEHSATAFFDVWHTYRKVVATKIKAHIERVLRVQFAGRPFSFLDLGCGDAATLAPLLSNMAIQRYKGVILVLPTGLGLPRHSSRTGGGYRPL